MDIEEKIPKEVLAYYLVKLYFEEIARVGMKRKLDLDSIISAYKYVLKKLEEE